MILARMQEVRLVDSFQKNLNPEAKAQAKQGSHAASKTIVSSGLPFTGTVSVSEQEMLHEELEDDLL